MFKYCLNKTVNIKEFKFYTYIYKRFCSGDISNYSVKVKGSKYEDTYKEGDSVKLAFDLNNMNFYKGGKRVVPVSVTE